MSELCGEVSPLWRGGPEVRCTREGGHEAHQANGTAWKVDMLSSVRQWGLAEGVVRAAERLLRDHVHHPPDASHGRLEGAVAAFRDQESRLYSPLVAQRVTRVSPLQWRESHVRASIWADLRLRLVNDLLREGRLPLALPALRLRAVSRSPLAPYHREIDVADGVSDAYWESLDQRLEVVEAIMEVPYWQVAQEG